MRIFYFNPYNDLALAAATEHFTPPSQALAVERAGACLPLWWAREDDVVLVRDEAALADARETAARFGLADVAVLRLKDVGKVELHPWGWSRHVAGVFARAGMAREQLPSGEWLDYMRLLSHRRTAITVLRRLGWPEELTPAEAFTTNDAMEHYRRWGRAVMKLPWSGSGRGVMLAHEIPDTTLRGYIEGVIRRQGSIIVEPYYRRRLDFAMLFDVGDRVKYKGISVFGADGRGRYTGNIVAPQPELRAMTGVNTERVRPEVGAALHILAEKGYRGPAGVDMMVYVDDEGEDGLQVMPCIEVNLRWTMGMAAAKLAERGLRGELRYNVAPSGVTVAGRGPCFNIE